MADARAEFEAHKTAASNYQSQLQNASSQDEAVDLAIQAVESLMGAMKLTTNKDERLQLKQQCTVIMDMADRIKNSTSWKPQQLQPMSAVPAHTSNPATLPSPAPPSQQRDEIGQWVANIANSDSSVPLASGRFSDTSSMLHTSTSTAPVHSRLTPTETRTLVSIGADPSNNNLDAPDAVAKQVLNRYNDPELLSNTSTIADERFNPSIQRSFQDQHQLDTKNCSTGKPEKRSLFPSNTVTSGPKGRVLRLPEPISTRDRSKRENIILWQASAVNGFKFPPWDKNPTSADFLLELGAKPFVETRDLTLSPYQQQFFQEWVRAQEALPPPSISSTSDSYAIDPMKTPQSIDLVQDAATDCSVVASLCAGIARAERGHAKILSNLVWPYDKSLDKPVISSNGKYIVRLNFNGCWRKVVIDDRLPLSKTHRLIHVIDRNNPGLLWPALLEKAYLKVRGGYDFPGSNSCSDLWTLTGWIPEQIYLQEADTVPDQLWNRVYRAFMYGDILVTAGTGKMSTRQERELGLEGQHSYVILDMKETEEDRLLLVKNPWVEGKGWRGPRPMISTSPSTNMAKDMDGSTLTSATDEIGTRPTTFWIALDDVIRHFESLYLNWNPGLFAHRQDIHFEWMIERQTKSDRCVVRNPQFSVSIKKKDEVWLLLSRHFRDTPEQHKEESDAFNDGSIRAETHRYTSGEPLRGFMSIYVCNGNGERIYMKESYLECSPDVNTPQALLRFSAEANATYTILIEQDELPASTYSFSLSAFSGSAISLEPASSRYAHQKLLESGWTKQTAGGTVDVPTYFSNPQFTLEAKSRCSVAILLQSIGHSHPMHVTLAIGHGKRLHRLQRRDVIADSGGYRDRAVFAECDLQPGTYTIICSLFDEGKIGGFTLQLDSTSDVAVKQLPREGAGLIQCPGLKPACFGPEMHKVAAPLQLHRLAKFVILARFLKARSPRSNDLGMQARSPLLFSIEAGRGPEKRVLICSEDGQHSDSLTIRSGSFDLSPTDQERANLWLVLDRLSKPGGPIEELYEVEVFTDIPRACSIGTWREWDD